MGSIVLQINPRSVTARQPSTETTKSKYFLFDLSFRNWRNARTLTLQPPRAGYIWKGTGTLRLSAPLVVSTKWRKLSHLSFNPSINSPTPGFAIPAHSTSPPGVSTNGGKVSSSTRAISRAQGAQGTKRDRGKEREREKISEMHLTVPQSFSR